jgi:8-oxo-dGTP pyrophosphatase MutT (NUDIX family)
MENLFNHIKMKSLAWIEREGMIFVVTMPDSVKQDYYFRPIGGTVEYGETSLETVKREVMEELQTSIEVTGAPLILENLFTLDDKFGHEVDFVYPCAFSDESFYEDKPYKLIEANGEEFEAMWIKVSDCLEGMKRLVPEPMLEWYKQNHQS